MAHICATLFFCESAIVALSRCNRRVLFYIVKRKVCYCNHHALHESCKRSGAVANFIVFCFWFSFCDAMIICYCYFVIGHFCYLYSFSCMAVGFFGKYA